MRLLFIRHGDPDYVHDTLTEKGHREAELLSRQALKMKMGSCFVSPLGRAQATAGYSLKKLGCKAQTMDWLREFPAAVDLNKHPELLSAYPSAGMKDGVYLPRIPWDIMPSYLSDHMECMDSEKWRQCEICRCSDVAEVYDHVTEEFDKLLAGHGYRREGGFYHVDRENTETLTFFCHFAITCVLLSHLWNQSPFTLWHSLALAPTSVTEVVTEERQKGTALFRGLRLGDVSHLAMASEPVSFAARFCEVYSDKMHIH